MNRSVDSHFSSSDDEHAGLTNILATPVTQQHPRYRPLLQNRRRKSSVFFPPGFVPTKFETIRDDDVGVVFQAGYESTSQFQPPKVMNYDPRKLMFSLAAWRALKGSIISDATAFKNLWYRLVGFNMLALAFNILAATPFAGASSVSALSELNSVLASGLFFILGPFVGFAVSRWWQIRKDGVGGLWGAVDDLSTWAACWFHNKSLADRSARALVMRLGLLSHALLYKQAREEDDHLDDLVAAGLLHEHEARTLLPLASKPQVVWSWMTSFWVRALGTDNALGTTLIEHASMLSPLVHDRCMRGRGAIGTALAFIDTQQPFPYVHLLFVITDVALAVNSATCGLQAGRHLLAAETAHAEAPLILICAFVRVTSFVMSISGLLAIGVHLDNPMGDDPVDFPALAYQVFMKKECEAFAAGVDAIDLGAGWWEGLGAGLDGSAAEPSMSMSVDRRRAAMDRMPTMMEASPRASDAS